MKSKSILIALLILSALLLACQDQNSDESIEVLESQIAQLESRINALETELPPSKSTVLNVSKTGDGMVRVAYSVEGNRGIATRDFESDSVCATEALIGMPLPKSCAGPR